MPLRILTGGALNVFERILKGFKRKGDLSNSNLTVFAKEHFPQVCLNYHIISSHDLFLLDLLINLILDLKY